MSGRSLQGPRSLQRPRALAGLTALSAVLALAAFLAGCTPQEAQPVFHAERNPATLADWQVLQIRAGVLGPTKGVIPYELNTPLFSDYAHKLRTVWLPAGTRAGYGADGVLQLPVGSILSKTFYYPRRDAGNGAGASQGALQATAAAIGVLAGGRLALDQVQLIETRLLVRRAQGWQAVSYVWDDSQRHARLQRVGEIIPLELEGVGKFDYVVPDINQCAACHATDVERATLAPIGLKARHLDRDHDYGGKVGQKNQLVHLEQLGLLEAAAPAASASDGWTRAASWNDESASLDSRARAYLDINCGHCHNRQGPADTSGLALDAAETSPIALGVCKSPVAAGRGTGNKKFDIVPGHPDESIMVYRMASQDPGEMMPELGRSLVHREGLELIRRWIAEWPGAPGCAQEASNSARQSASSARLSRSQG